MYPLRCTILLQKRRDVSVDDDVDHAGSGDGGVA
jgi:hypothetical protein